MLFVLRHLRLHKNSIKYPLTLVRTFGIVLLKKGNRTMKTEGKTLVEVLGQENGKHGIELRFGKGRKLTLLSYAVYVNGACQVSHETTASNRKLGMDLKRHLEIERTNNPSLPII